MIQAPWVEIDTNKLAKELTTAIMMLAEELHYPKEQQPRIVFFDGMFQGMVTGMGLFFMKLYPSKNMTRDVCAIAVRQAEACASELDEGKVVIDNRPIDAPRIVAEAIWIFEKSAGHALGLIDKQLNLTTQGE